MRPAAHAVRGAVRRALGLRGRETPRLGRERGRRLSSRLLRLAALVALASGAGDLAVGQPPYRREHLSEFAGLFAGQRSRPEFVDLDGDGDLDATVGEFFGTLVYLRNAGSSASPIFFGEIGSATPLAGIDAGYRSSPEAVDLDADGDLDLVIGTYSGLVVFYENSGSSAVPAFVEATGSANPFDGIDVGYLSCPSLADLDGDGDLDAVLGAEELPVRYFSNTGTSTIPAFVEQTGSANPFDGIDVGARSSPDLADLDGDGDLDATVGRLTGTVTHLVNTGTSNAPSFVEATGSANPFDGFDVGAGSAPLLADLDADGDFDLVAGEYDGDLTLFVNTGSANAPSFVESTGSASPFGGVDVGDDSSPKAADLDGDGDLDAAVGELDGVLSYFRNTGGSSSPAFVEITGSANPLAGVDAGYRSQAALVDFDGDGDVDAFVGENDGAVRTYRNTGSSTVPAFLESTGSANPFAGVDVGDRSSPALADLDGDGDLDAALGEYGGILHYFKNTGSSASPMFAEGFGTANPFAGVDVSSLSAPALGDLDGDGDVDLAVGNSPGTVRTFANTGSSASPAFVESTGSANPFLGVRVGGRSRPALVDLDQDGDLDALIGDYRGRIAFYRSGWIESLFDDGFADDFESGDLTAWSNF